MYTTIATRLKKPMGWAISARPLKASAASQSTAWPLQKSAVAKKAKPSDR